MQAELVEEVNCSRDFLTAVMDTTRLKQFVPVAIDNTTRTTPEDYERRFEFRSTTDRIRLERIYGTPEVLLELAMLIIVLGIALAVCLVRHNVSN